MRCGCPQGTPKPPKRTSSAIPQAQRTSDYRTQREGEEPCHLSVNKLPASQVHTPTWCPKRLEVTSNNETERSWSRERGKNKKTKRGLLSSLSPLPLRFPSQRRPELAQGEANLSRMRSGSFGCDVGLGSFMPETDLRTLNYLRRTEEVMGPV